MLRNHAIFSNAENVSGYLVEHNETFYQFDGKQLSVKTYLSFKKNDEVKEAPLPLVLNSNGVTVKAIMLDGRALSTDRYVMTRGKITLSDLPPVFKLEVELTLELISNEKLEDLYNIKGIYPECGITEDATDLVSAFDYIDVMASCEIIKVDDQKQHALLTAGSSAMLAEKITQVKGCSWFQVKCKENLFLHHHQMISLPWFYRSIMIPMVLSTHYHNTELEPIIKHDKNPLHRVEAAKIYVQKLLEKSVAEYDNCKVGSLPPSFVEVFRCVFLDRSLTARYKAAIFSIPSEMDIAVMTKSKDVDVVHMARNQMLDVITERLGIHFSSMYDDEREQKHEEDGALALRNTLDRRQLENVCLFYLSRQSDKKIKTLLMNRFREMLVSSLPDCIFAMQCLIDMCQYTGKIALDLFYQRWKYDQNAIKLWIGAQALSASPDAMHHLRGLLKSDRFDASNRAHMAALTYAYLANFSLCFSAKRSGYYLFVELLAMMDASHNVVKDEMRRVLTYWQGRLDPRRNQWIKEVIDHIDGVKVFKCREISSVSFDSPLAVIISETPFVPKKEEAASPHAKQGFFKEATLPSLQRSTASSLDSQQEPEERLVPALRLADA